MVMINKLQCCNSRRKKRVIHHIGPLRPLAGVHYLGFQRDPEGHRKEETVGVGQLENMRLKILITKLSYNGEIQNTINTQHTNIDNNHMLPTTRNKRKISSAY